MATADKLAEFNSFATKLLETEGDSALSLEEVYDRWWSEQHRDDDLEAIRLSVADFEQGEQGEDAREELARHRSERADGQAL